MLKRFGFGCAVLSATLMAPVALAGYALERITGGLDVPWGMVQLPNRDLLISERDGRLIRIADGGRGARTELGGVPEVASKGQGGLLDLALHPDYATNGWLYFS
ncbi:MAG: PQQ-dependent sugar dehydrogenase, partial [Pseudomonadota bacterium]